MKKLREKILFTINKTLKLHPVSSNPFYILLVARFSRSIVRADESIEIVSHDPCYSFLIPDNASIGIFGGMNVFVYKNGIIKIVWPDSHLVAALVIAIPLLAVMKGLNLSTTLPNDPNANLVIDVHLSVIEENVAIELFYERFYSPGGSTIELISKAYTFAYKINRGNNNDIETSISGTCWKTALPRILTTIRIFDSDLNPIIWETEWCLIQESENTNVMSDKNQTIKLNMTRIHGTISLMTHNDITYIYSSILNI